MKPGPELDALVAEKAIGFRRATAETAPNFAHHIDVLKQTWFLSDEERGTCFSAVPEYSTEIAAAWEVVEKLIAKHYFPSVQHLPGDRGEENFWECTLGWEKLPGADLGLREYVSATASTAPHAICLAALKAVGVEV
jgi:hypothetical protein